MLCGNKSWTLKKSLKETISGQQACFTQQNYSEISGRIQLNESKLEQKKKKSPPQLGETPSSNGRS